MRVIMILALLGLGLSGCTAPVDSVEHLSEETYKIALHGKPDSVLASEPFIVEFAVTGNLTHFSDHVGAHYWQNSTDDPMRDFAASAGCKHVPGGTEVPAVYTVECQQDYPGMMYLRGHVRITEGEQFDWFSEEIAIEVLGF